MQQRALMTLALIGFCAAAGAATTSTEIQLPSGWRIDSPSGDVATTGTMPQGIALSPDKTKLAVLESGYNPPALRILDAKTLGMIAVIPLKGAFGRPVWRDDGQVFVAGANLDAVLIVDVTQKRVSATIETGKGSWPTAIALSSDKKLLAVSDDLINKVTVVDPAAPQTRREFTVGSHPSGLIFSADGKTLYVGNRGASTLGVITLATGAIAEIAVGTHPVALALSNDASKLYVTDSDDDGLTTVDLATAKANSPLNIGLHASRLSGYGASPNAIAVATDGTIYVSCGAQNAIVVVKNNRVASRIPTGWYPSGVAIANSTLYVSNGKGEGAHPNPEFSPYARHSAGYVASTLNGSVRAIDLSSLSGGEDVIRNATPTWTAPVQTVVRANGPIQHIIYIIKENRSYDQVLGDLPRADGDPKLVWFGEKVTPNQHTIARRFGIFDNAFTNSQVSADGHNWTDAAFANDYLERFWPANYGGRRDLYDFEDEVGATVPHGGYLWDAAAAAHLTYRDYGEATTYDPQTHAITPVARPSLRGHIDLRYRGWDLTYSDQSRINEWSREFESFVRAGNLPQLEIVYLPNDHTSGTKVGRPTPRAYVANNDYALGRLVDAVSHSRYWKSTAIFALEDDAQNGPDHVSDQRSTFYVAGAYARPGVYHAHYATTSVLHTIELILGLHPLSIYDAVALPMYAAFGLTPNQPSFNAIKPKIRLIETNQKTAYGAALSATLNWNKPDAVDPNTLNAILRHAIKPR